MQCKKLYGSDVFLINFKLKNLSLVSHYTGIIKQVFY